MTNVLLTPQGPPLSVGDMGDLSVAATPGPAVLFASPATSGDVSPGSAPETPEAESTVATASNRPLAYREADADWHELGYEAADHWEGLSPELRDRLIADRTAKLSREEYSVTTSGASASMITSNWTYSGSPRMYRIAGELRELAEVLAEIGD
ncbi:hypothetical protein SAMN04489751_0495 [Brevibacterium sandarakinum]|uniref:Uncharacterized protein n=1 Tax=Brevibacterium sandarakinum TaxID=629680 RepID=A0A1H1M2C6_BRESA|nr:hypothetical protein [Brevibacterium sandarakinum]SDR80169.1 hypothetical protein SAMN04489751_0495 [Brevibacterium sandarakinum]